MYKCVGTWRKQGKISSSKMDYSNLSFSPGRRVDGEKYRDRSTFSTPQSAAMCDPRMPNTRELCTIVCASVNENCDVSVCVCVCGSQHHCEVHVCAWQDGQRLAQRRCEGRVARSPSSMVGLAASGIHYHLGAKPANCSYFRERAGQTAFWWMLHGQNRTPGGRLNSYVVRAAAELPSSSGDPRTPSLF